MSTDSIGPSGTFRQFSSFVADIDLISLMGRPCRAILVETTGAIVLVPTTPISGSATETLSSLVAQTMLPVQANKIVASGTTITRCTVFW